MCLTIVAKSELSDAQVRFIEERLSAPEHAYDNGPPKVWRVYQQGLYAVVRTKSNQPIGLVEVSGLKDCISPGWWLDIDFRGKGYGTKLVDALAAYLKAEGYTGVGRIEIQTHDHAYDIASQKLAERFQGHFIQAQNG
jgi:RimJ/RimL family protein N-acetyltransferase